MVFSSFFMQQKDLNALRANVVQTLDQRLGGVQRQPFQDVALVPGVLGSGLFEIAFRNSDHMHLVQGANLVLQSLAETYGLRYDPIPERKPY